MNIAKDCQCSATRNLFLITRQTKKRRALHHHTISKNIRKSCIPAKSQKREREFTSDFIDGFEELKYEDIELGSAEPAVGCLFVQALSSGGVSDNRAMMHSAKSDF